MSAVVSPPRPLRPPGPTTPGAAGLDDLRPVVADLIEATGIDAMTLGALVERAVADTHARLLPDLPRVVARFDVESGRLALERLTEAGPEPVAIPPDVARQSALAIRAGVAGLLRDAEQGRVLREGSARRGELVDAIVDHQDGARTWHLRVMDLVALLPPEEQVGGERLERNQHLKVVALDAHRRGRDAVLEVSRSHPNLLRRLLEQEVPEMTTGQVVVKALVREAGRRSKVAVDAPLGGVDPEGACIGPKGVRIRAVVAELGEEQVHVVGWSSDPATYVARALGPASVLTVELDEDSHTAHVTVPEHQLSLAIGRAGENARLAARLTGWRIDIRGEATSP